MPPYVKVVFLIAIPFASLVGLRTLVVAEPPVSPAEQKIRDALQGRADKPTGDGVLDDVIGLIKKKGSILDGSSLDPNQDSAEKVTTAGLISRKAHAAEQLLRASRLLSQFDSNDPSRLELVNQMRAEAVKLLTE